MRCAVLNACGYLGYFQFYYSDSFFEHVYAHMQVGINTRWQLELELWSQRARALNLLTELT